MRAPLLPLLLLLLLLTVLVVLLLHPSLMQKAETMSMLKEQAVKEQRLKDRTPINRRPPSAQSRHLRSFAYINWPTACGKLPLLLLAIVSQPSDFDARSLRRRLFCSVGELSGFQIRCVFVLGSAANASAQSRVDAEAAADGDILQLSFLDSYRNLTYKSLAILDWTVAGCPSAQFVLKTDMDSLVNPYNLVQLLLQQQIGRARRLYGGFMISGAKPFRSSGPQKWRLTQQQFPMEKFPPYASGLGYIIARQAAAEMLKASDSLPPVPMEDVYVGLCASKAGVSVHDFWKFFIWQLGKKWNWCSYHQAVSVHRVTEEQLKQMWTQICLPASTKPKC